jgi:hypothetical protein
MPAGDARERREPRLRGTQRRGRLETVSWRRGVAGAVAVIAFVSGGGAPVGASEVTRRSPDPKEMVLRPGDLPAGFGNESAEYVSNLQVARERDVTLGQLKRWGRLSGYDVVFGKRGLVGLLQIDSSANTYETPRGARASLRGQFAAATGPNGKGLVFKRLSTGGAIGHEARLYRATTKNGGVTVDVYAVVWRYSTVTAAIIAGAIAGTADPEAVVALARKQQRYIAAEVG